MNRRDPRLLFRSIFLSAIVLSIPLASAQPAVAAEEPPAKLLGQCTVAQLAEEPYAEWFDAGYDEYTPDPATVEALRRVDLEGLEIEIFFGTWCGDSRREVPRMLKLLDALGFPASGRRLIGVDTGEQHKRSPGGEEKGLEIYRVPTLVVSRGGQEVSRIVEYPALSLERDLLAIFEGRDYEPSYTSYPVVRRWLREGLLTDPNVSADGLAEEVRSLISSEGDLAAVGSVFLSRGDVSQAVKLFEVNSSLHWASATSHARLANALIKAGDLEAARVSALRALKRNEDPEWTEDLLDLVQRSTSSPAVPRLSSGAVDIETLEEELRATETALAATFAAGDMDTFASLVAEEAVFYSGDNPLRGQEAIVAHWRRLRGDGEEPPFTWGPERVAVEASGSHGLSTGQVHSGGRWISSFASTWKWTSEGWRIILDVGPRCPPAAPSEG